MKLIQNFNELFSHSAFLYKILVQCIFYICNVFPLDKPRYKCSIHTGKHSPMWQLAAQLSWWSGSQLWWYWGSRNCFGPWRPIVRSWLHYLPALLPCTNRIASLNSHLLIFAASMFILYLVRLLSNVKHGHYVSRSVQLLAHNTGSVTSIFALLSLNHALHMCDKNIIK